MLLFKQPEAVIDMKQRYVGHCNVGTDIKQASFLGQRGTFNCCHLFKGSMPWKLTDWVQCLDLNFSMR